MIQKLIVRLEQATPDRNLNEKIAFHIRWRPQNRESKQSFEEHEAKHDYETAWIAHAPWRLTWAIPDYTASIDAALTLVPEGYVFSVDRNFDGSGSANVCKGDFDIGGAHCSKAATPAIALCIAALKARSLTSAEETK